MFCFVQKISDNKLILVDMFCFVQKISDNKLILKKVEHQETMMC